MNRLPLHQRTQIIQLLCEGTSMRSTSRVVGVSINTVTKLLVDAGMACGKFHDDHVRGISSRLIQADETWSFIYGKDKSIKQGRVSSVLDSAGSVWTWTAIDPETKLMVSWLVGDRSAETAKIFMDDLQSRLANRVQLTTDGHHAYLEATEEAFGGSIDYSQLVKIYGENGRYEGANKRRVSGSPDMELVTTAHVERSNLTLRMGNRRFTRRTNAFSKRLRNHILMLNVFFIHYNFCRVHLTLGQTPAMEAGLAEYPCGLDWIIELADAHNAATRQNSPGSN